MKINFIRPCESKCERSSVKPLINFLFGHLKTDESKMIFVQKLQDILDGKEMDQEVLKILDKLFNYSNKMKKIWDLIRLCGFGFWEKGWQFAKKVFHEINFDEDGPFRAVKCKKGGGRGFDLHLNFQDDTVIVTQNHYYKIYAMKKVKGKFEKGSTLIRNTFAWTASPASEDEIQKATLTVSNFRPKKGLSRSEEWDGLKLFINYTHFPENSDDNETLISPRDK